MHSITRRNWIGAAALSAVAIPSLSYAIDPIRRSKASHLRLSLAAYSVRDLLTKQDSGWDLFKFVDYCRDLGIQGAELTSYYFPKEITNEYLVDLKQHCHKNGVSISGGAIRNDFCQSDETKRLADIEHTKKWIDRYALLGAPVIRIFAGNQPKNDSWDTTVERCVKACETACEYAHQKGVYLALENHGGVTAKAEGLLEIVKRVNAKSFGINFDSGNFRSTSEPYKELEQIAPYAVNAQIKVIISPDGQSQPANFERIVKILRQAQYSGWVALEYEEKEDPLIAIPKWIDQLKPLMA